MINYILPITFSFLLFHQSFSQNYVSNSGFETLTDCPSQLGQISLASPWYSPNWGTPDIFNTCSDTIPLVNYISIPNNLFGNAFPHNGNGFACCSFIQNSNSNFYCEYIQAPLNNTMNFGDLFKVSLYVSCAEGIQDLDEYGMISKIGVSFSKHPIITTNTQPLQLDFQIKSNTYVDVCDGWIEIIGQYSALGGEKYLTIGIVDEINTTITGSCTMNNHNGAFYYIDDVSVEKIECPNQISYQSNQICKSDSNYIAFISDSTNGYFYSSTSGLSIDSISGLITPNESLVGSYFVNYYDSICLSTFEVEILGVDLDSSITIYEGESIELTSNSSGNINWTPSEYLSCVNCNSPIASPNITTEYCLNTKDENCILEECITIIVKNKCTDLFIPNAFTPNNNNIDDELCLYNSECFLYINFRIFNEWGEIVFESNDTNNCWDGKFKEKRCSTGLYTYTFFAKNQNGENILLKGSILLL